MKKIFSLILLFVLFTVTPVFASVNTYERTEENFRVESWVDINGSNKYKILTTPSVDADEKVYDFADILSSSEKENIYDLIKEFIDTYFKNVKDKYKLISIDDIKEYSTTLFNSIN